MRFGGIPVKEWISVLKTPAGMKMLHPLMWSILMKMVFNLVMFFIGAAFVMIIFNSILAIKVGFILAYSESLALMVIGKWLTR